MSQPINKNSKKLKTKTDSLFHFLTRDSLLNIKFLLLAELFKLKNVLNHGANIKLLRYTYFFKFYKKSSSHFFRFKNKFIHMFICFFLFTNGHSALLLLFQSTLCVWRINLHSYHSPPISLRSARCKLYYLFIQWFIKNQLKNN